MCQVRVRAVLLARCGCSCCSLVTDASRLLHVVCCSFMLLDAYQCIGQAILKGMGRQNLGALLGFIGFYAVSLPLAFGMAFWAHLGPLSLSASNAALLAHTCRSLLLPRC